MMHLNLNQRLQEVASYKRDKFKPEELDLALNKAMFRFLEMGVDENFEGTEVKLKHVAALMQKNKVQEPIQPQVGDTVYEDNILNSYVVLPPDFYWLINNRLEIITDPINCGTAPTLGTVTYTEYTAIVPFPALGTTPFFANTLVSSSTLGTLYTSPTEIAAGFTSSNSKYVVVNNIIETLYRKRTDFKVYWERYRDTYNKNSFIFVATIPIGTMTVTSNAQSVAVAQSTTTYAIYNRGGIPAITNKTITVSSAKIVPDDPLYDVLRNNAYYAPTPTMSIVNQTQDYLIFYRDKSFLITRSYTDYIRKPRTISLLLGQDCELADVTHPKILDLALELLKLDIKDPSYPQTVQDTQLRTN